MIPFFRLDRQQEVIKEELNEAIQRVLNSNWYILGKEGEQFEEEFSRFNNTKYGVGLNSGTDALQIALRALESEKSEVITVSNTAIPTIAAIYAANCKPIFVDTNPETHLIDIDKIEEKLTNKTRAILPVNLFGQAIETKKIKAITDIPIIEDCAQSIGMTENDSLIQCHSFYPTKNLGAYGDAGAITTNDWEIADKCKKIRNYGQTNRYHHVMKGINSRLDELQAAILRVKLKRVNIWNQKRRDIAKKYSKELTSVVPPTEKNNHNYHLYVVKTPKRDQLKEYLEKNNIKTEIHYPTPAHLQPGYPEFHYLKGTLSVTEKQAKEILSIPIYPELTQEEIETVISKINGAEFL